MPVWELTAEHLKKILHYDPDTGIFTWKVRRGRCSAGTRAAGKNPKRYFGVGINGRHYYVHQLAVLYMTGSPPTGEVDHINRDKLDNRWINLRDTTRAVNAQNIVNAKRSNSSGLLGAHRFRDHYQSQITRNGLRTVLGKFRTAQEAHEAYMDANRKFHAGNTL